MADLVCDITKIDVNVVKNKSKMVDKLLISYFYH